jgi:hypothetical protein
MTISRRGFMTESLALAASGLARRRPGSRQLPSADAQPLTDIRMRNVCILADESSRTYYAVSSGGRTVRAFTSKDLLTWTGPQTIFQTPAGFWGSFNIRSIWAPELHAYKGRHYLFLTFDTDALFPEHWRKWRPRVTPWPWQSLPPASFAAPGATGPSLSLPTAAATP